MKIKNRIVAVYNEISDVGGCDYYELMYRVFPSDEYPNASRYATQGGPPGCAMAFNRAITDMGGSRNARDRVFIPREARVQTGQTHE